MDLFYRAFFKPGRIGYMNKADLINKIAARLSVPQKECREHLEALQTVIAEELNEGNGIILQGFGCLNLWKQTEREGRNPRTGETVPILPRRSVKFRPGKMLLQKLNT